jgi:hypothetical protein
MLSFMGNIKKELKYRTQFIAMLGTAVLACCATENPSATQRLNVHSSVINAQGDFVLSQVVVEDYSAYADAALAADDWHSS